MPFVFSHVEYCDMHFVYGFCDRNARAAVDEYQRRFPDRLATEDASSYTSWLLPLEPHEDVSVRN
jgi:hypothetical protein